MSGVSTVDLKVSEDISQRIDIYLSRALEKASRTKVQRSISEGHVTLNNRPVRRSSMKVKQGDRIIWHIPAPEPLSAVPEKIALRIIFEDEHLLVVNKEAGMPTHPGPGHPTGTLVNALLNHTGGRAIASDERPQSRDIGLSSLYTGPYVRPGIVHRLDKDTSGLLVVAKNDETHLHLAAQFEQRTIQREYHGIVWGVPDPAVQRIETSIGRDPRNRKKMAVAPGKHAITHMEVVEPFSTTALVAFRLETGRTHQIRVHAQYAGHPILGDPTYGGRTIRYGQKTGRRKATFNRIFSILKRQALHARTLTFVHPHTKKIRMFSSTLPEDMQLTLDLLCRADT